MDKEKIMLGIFGGMGPEATANLYKQIIRLTPAEKDQDHIPTLIYSLPQVPERTTSIRNQDTSIISFIVDGVTRLERAGASFIAIPCNTVHYYYDYMQEAVSIQIIHMIRETATVVKELYPNAEKIGLLATSGTIESGLYEKELTQIGLNVILPDKKVLEDNVMEAVFGIKAGMENAVNETLLAEAGQHLVEKGAEVINLGCTEIPLAFNPSRVNVHVISATRVLADRSIQMYNELKARG